MSALYCSWCDNLITKPKRAIPGWCSYSCRDRQQRERDAAKNKRRAARAAARWAESTGRAS